MASMNPQEYYEDELNHGSYVYVSLEEMVTNFIANYTGDGKILGKPKRFQIINQFKQGIKKFTINALKQIKAVELELGDTLDIILPPDYVSYVRISYVNPETGDLMVLSKNPNDVIGSAYLQDNDAEILFDNDGFILEGSTFASSIKDDINKRTITDACVESNIYQLDVAKNANGTFLIDTRAGKIHFSSDNVSRIIMLEYVSDGLEYSNESDIKVSKLAEIALYNYVNYHLMFPMSRPTMYEKNDAKKMWNAEYTNARIALMDIRIADTMICLNGKQNWFK